MPILFFRNDDVRGTLDNALIQITELFVSHRATITHAVEPANVSREVADWLLQMKSHYPNFVEIIQHGLDHNVKTNIKRGEFGGDRSYNDQLKDVRAGKDLMNKYFADQWFPAFSFPFGVYNKATLEAIQSEGYKLITTGVGHSFKRQILNIGGRIFRKKFIYDIPINYYMKLIPGYSLVEIPISINITKKQIDVNQAIQKSHIDIIAEIQSKSKVGTIGILMHHRWLSKHDVEELNYLLLDLKQQAYSFTNIENIYNVAVGNL